jgi:hypothetical protein
VAPQATVASPNITNGSTPIIICVKSISLLAKYPRPKEVVVNDVKIDATRLYCRFRWRRWRKVSQSSDSAAGAAVDAVGECAVAVLVGSDVDVVDMCRPRCGTGQMRARVRTAGNILRTNIIARQFFVGRVVMYLILITRVVVGVGSVVSYWLKSLAIWRISSNFSRSVRVAQQELD